MKKNKGFTLIELLAVIVILAIIALIATPIILNMISTAKKASFRDSVLIASDTIDNYMLKNEISTIPEDKGITIEDLNNSVLKSDLTGGSFRMINGKLEAYFVTDGKYCASGKLTSLRIVSSDKCYESDSTAPVVDGTKLSLSSTTNTVIVTLGEGFAEDPESGIREYKIILTGNEEKKEVTLDDTTKSYIFKGLAKNTEYKIEVKAINEALKESEMVSKTIPTKNIDNPTIELINSPTEAVNNYVKQQTAIVTYHNDSIANPIYYIKTTKEGTSNIGVTQSCGTKIEPENCNNITGTTTLAANTWYKVSGNINVTYTKTIDEAGNLYAITYDGTNYSDGSTATLFKIDNVTPAINFNNFPTFVSEKQSYEISNYINASYGKSGGVYSCSDSKNNKISNLNQLSVGKQQLNCTVQGNTGNSSSKSIDVHIFRTEYTMTKKDELIWTWEDTRRFYKTNDGWAIVAYAYFKEYNYTGLILVSKDPYAVFYHARGDGSYDSTLESLVTIDYLGTTWYVSSDQYWYTGDFISTAGNAKKITVPTGFRQEGAKLLLDQALK